GHRRPAADRGRGPPAPAAVRGGLGAPVRGRPDPGILRQADPPPPQPRRQPRGQPRPVADRDHPDELPCPDPRLRRTAHQRGPVEEGDHPLPEALRRPPGLPPPAPRRLTPQTPGAARPAIRLPHPCWPANDSSAAPGPLPLPADRVTS